jgi:hypothetical protein
VKGATILDAQFDADFQSIPLPDYPEQNVEEMRASAQAFDEFVARRHTVREFSSRPVPRDIIEQCILTAGRAPCGANHRPWHFAVIGDGAMEKSHSPGRGGGGAGVL